MLVMKRFVILFFLPLASLVAVAQESASFVSPLNIPLVLSANFGELRPNHFHSGLDFKTQGRTGLPVYAADEGYVSRVAVSPWGYGKALYITHPSGYTTVYAHLDSFGQFIAKRIREIQYEKESFAIDETFLPGEFPVSRGMRIATSGNSGSSGGPHLHFEVRHTESESPVDPLRWFAGRVKDGVAPEPRQIALYPHDGMVDGKRSKYVRALQAGQGTRTYEAASEFTAWGRVSVGIKAYDRMTGTTNIYGVHTVRCWIDDKPVFSAVVDSITFAETRYVNALIDYDELRSNKGSTIMRSYVAPGNRLSTVYEPAGGDGTFTIDEARRYRGRYELTDAHGNTSVVRFVIRGVRQELPDKSDEEGVLFACNHDNLYADEDIHMELPSGALYEDIRFKHSFRESDTYCSAVHQVHAATVPLHRWCELALKLSCDTLPDSCYYMVRIRNGRKTPVVGKYDAGWYVASVREFGTYAVAFDRTAPTITPLNADKWGTAGTVSLKISDTGSGIATYRGEIDGRFCLFEYDGKTARLICRLKYAPLAKGKKHRLVMTVTDACGNRKTLRRSFTW